MTSSPFGPAIEAITAALGDRLAPGITTFKGLFTDDAVIDVPFDGDVRAEPIVGRPAIQRMVASLVGILSFQRVDVRSVFHTTDPATVILEYGALLHRSDLARTLRRRYVSVLRLRDGYIVNLREYGGPFMAINA